MATFFSPEDIKDLKRSVPFTEVLSYFGISIKTHGNSKSILCPLHSDSHYGSCLIRKNGAYCFVCSEQINATKLAMSQGLSFYETMNLFAQLLNRADEFEQKGASKMKPKAQVPQKPRFSMEDMDKIGLCSFTKEHIVSYSFHEPSFEKKNKCDFVKIVEADDTIVWGTLQVSGNPLRELEKEDPEAYEFLIQSKAKEKMAEAINLARKLKEPKSQIGLVTDSVGLNRTDIINGAKVLYEEAEEILLRIGGITPSPKELLTEIKMAM